MLVQVTDLAIIHEHPQWFQPLFAALDRAGIAWEAIHTEGHMFDPLAGAPPAPVIFNRVAMSSFLRAAEHPIFYTQALLDHWEGLGAVVLNGAGAMAIDASKARQLALISRLGFAGPATRVVHDRGALVRAAAVVGFPLVIKADIGGAGAGIMRFDTPAQLAEAVDRGATPESVNGVVLCQALVPRRNNVITRVEMLGGRYLYALDIQSGADTFDLCPADATESGRPPVHMVRAEPPPGVITACEMLAREAGMEACGIEYMIDDRCGTPRFYDINGLSNFVANPMDVLGWDPHDRLVARLAEIIRRAKG